MAGDLHPSGLAGCEQPAGTRPVRCRGPGCPQAEQLGVAGGELQQEDGPAPAQGDRRATEAAGHVGRRAGGEHDRSVAGAGQRIAHDLREGGQVVDATTAGRCPACPASHRRSSAASARSRRSISGPAAGSGSTGPGSTGPGSAGGGSGLGDRSARCTTAAPVAAQSEAAARPESSGLLCRADCRAAYLSHNSTDVTPERKRVATLGA